MPSQQRLARLAGVLYLVVGIAGGFSQLVVRTGVLVPGDAGATADRIRESAGLVRLGFVTDIVNITAFILVGLVLYALLAHVQPRIAGAFVAFNAIAVAVMGASLIAHAGALLVATDPGYATALGTASADALALLFLDMHRHGYLVAEVFFGLWLLPLGYLVYRSGYFPRVLGAALMVGCFGYLTSFATTVAAPGFESSLAALFAWPAGLAEIAFLAWLLVKGARVPAGSRSVPAGVVAGVAA